MNNLFEAQNQNDEMLKEARSVTLTDLHDNKKRKVCPRIKLRILIDLQT